MESHDILKTAVDKVGAKQVALDMRVSTPLVYKWCQEPSKEAGDDASGARNPLDRAYALFESTQDIGIVEWLCHRAHGIFVANPHIDGNKFDTEAIKHTQKLVQEFSDLLAVISASIANDGYIDEKEAKRIRKEWQVLKRYGEEFAKACEDGVFSEEKSKERDKV